MGTSSIILEAKNIKKIYRSGFDNEVVILDKVSFSVKENEIVSIIGSSGCGKTTLLQVCGLLDSATEGDLFIVGTNTNNLNEREKTKFRGEKIGFVYQMHHLFPEFSAIENTMLPLLAKNENENIAKNKAIKLLEQFGLAHRINHMPSELSGGEKQRVAIARAIINSPLILLADEPTGNLDNDNAKIISKILFNTIRSINSSMLLVTHNIDIAKMADRIITIENHTIKNL